MSAFVPPTWSTGLLVMASYFLIPLIIGIILAAILTMKKHPIIGVTVFVICLLCSCLATTVLWWENYDVPSVQEKVVTVESWQPKAGIQTDKNGVMVIDNADQLMLVTTDGESYLNEENFMFQKFNTRDILNTMKPNGTYKIKYYGWREGFNSGFPNILAVEEVVDESHAHNVKYSDYFGTKVIH